MPRSWPTFAALVAVGLVTLLGQVVLLRELLVASFGSELVALLALAVLLAGSAGGAFVGQRLGEARGAHLRVAFLAFAAALPAALTLARGLRRLFGGTPGAYLPFDEQLAGLALVLLPLGVLGGLLFERAARLHLAGGSGGSPPRTLAAAYAVESAGGLGGGALATLLLAAGASNLATALFAALVALVAAWLVPPSPLSPRPRSAPRRGPWAAATVLLAVALLVALAHAGELDRALTGWNHPALVTTRDTPYGRVSVTAAGGQVVVFVNDALAGESESVAAEELAHLAALEVARPERILLFGGVVEGLVPELLAHRPRELRVVEVDAALLAEVLPLLPPRTRDALADPAVRLVHTDPRSALADAAAAGERFDLLVVAMPEPDSAQANRVYTREFFTACDRILADTGVLALRLRGSENLLTPALARRTASIRRSLAAVFPSVAALPGTTTVLLASRAALSLDPELLASRLADRGVAPRLVTPAYLRYLFTNDRRESLERELATNRAPENRDGRPICYSYTLLLWLARFDPALAWLEWPAGADAGASAAPFVALAVLALLATGAVPWVRRRERWRRTLLAAAAGALGMLLEGVLILAYQVRHGVLYQDLGLLLTAFMAGLAVGAAGVDRARRQRARAAGWALIAGLVVTSLLAGQTLSLPTSAGLPLALLLLAAAGAGTGGLFARASGGREAGSGEIGSLYAADLAGGACGALVGTLVLVPLLGLAVTGLLLAVAAVTLVPLLAGPQS